MPPTSISLSQPRVALWKAVRRLLVIRLDNLGDVLMTTPALQALRLACPQARITLLASPSGAALQPHLPMIDEVIAYAAPWVKGPPQRPASKPGDFDIGRRISAGRYDAAVIFTTATQSPLPAALLCWQAGIGLRLAHCRENPYELLSDWVSDSEVIQTGMRHEVRRQLDLVASVGFEAPDLPLVFETRLADQASVRQRLQRAGGRPDQPYVLVHPGATAPSRRYPASWFGQAMAMVMQGGVQCVFTGSPAESQLVREAHEAAGGGVALTGDMSLGELGALIQDAEVLVCNNSGPAHIASAVGTPVVDLYALTNPQHTPWQVPARVLSHDVPCRHCLRSVCPEGHHACLREVSPVTVADAVMALLGQGADVDSPAAAQRPVNAQLADISECLPSP
ncbi:MAG: glycosyltransferase family 9 protein [Rubrivivax sp.]|nr:MAG: glycosyltransferase family 9 protein [Rubrivivax sp.]